jgi:hypothetical protein
MREATIGWVRSMSVTRHVVLDWILDLFTTYTQVGTTSTSSAIANLHTLQITTVFSSLLRLHHTFPGNGF